MPWTGHQPGTQNFSSFSTNGEQNRYEWACHRKQVCVCQQHAEQLQKQTQESTPHDICFETWLEKKKINDHSSGQ